jgi:hypothetical protein
MHYALKEKLEGAGIRGAMEKMRRTVKVSEGDFALALIPAAVSRRRLPARQTGLFQEG